MINMQRSKLPDDNLKMLSRIVNVPTGVVPFKKLQSDFKKHKQRSTNIAKI